MLFTDIVGSTDRAAAIGDSRWLELRAAHDAIVRRSLVAFRGREIERTGDGFLATFDGPARAVHCAARIRNEIRSLGLEIRAGLHTGEIERRQDEIGGMAVNIASRVLSLARPGEVLVSGTVTDLVVGAGIAFEDRGAETLKGVPGHLAAVRRRADLPGFPASTCRSCDMIREIAPAFLLAFNAHAQPPVLKGDADVDVAECAAEKTT